MQSLEDEIGVDLFIRTSRGLNLTEEGKLFLGEADNLLRGADDAVRRTRALSRGESGELHIGYLPTPTAEILPAALDSFQQANLAVKVILHEVTGDELTAGLLDGSFHLGVTVERMDEAALGLVFEELRRYRFCVVVARNHPLARRKSISVAEAAAQPLVGFRRREYSTADIFWDEVFGPHHLRPPIAVECDSATSLLMELEIGRGIAVLNEVCARRADQALLSSRFLIPKPLIPSALLALESAT
jgi:DNA-binding transcriptional LysR family regulator